MKQTIYRATLKTPQTRRDIINDFCRGKRVLDLGCVEHDINHADTDRWLHGQIVNVAASVVGVDYLPDAVDELIRKGYNVVCADVTKPIPINDKFEVIVIGNLIEHLTNFDGFFENIERLLTIDGTVLIGTANPFFREQYFYTAFRNAFFVNIEHTCWIDPVTLDQMAERHGFSTREVRWVKEKWRLSDIIFEGDRYHCNAFTGLQEFKKLPGIIERLFSPLLGIVIKLVAQNKWDDLSRRYGNDINRFLYLKLKAIPVEVIWRLFRRLIPTSEINIFELYVSILKRTNAPVVNDRKGATL